MQGTLRAPVSPAERTHDYVVIGHVSRDIVPATGAVQIGGTAFYSGLQAARLGLRTRIVTAGVPDEIAALVAPFAHEIDVEVQRAAATTSFEASGVGRARRLRVVAWAGPIAPPESLDAAILHLAPVARETAGINAHGAGFVGITPQGLIRRWGEDGAVRQVALDPAELPGRLDALVISDTERDECRDAVDAALALGAVVSQTSGREGAEVVSGAGAIRAPALRVVDPVDDLGAGDVYAATFFAALAAGLDPAAALRRGQAASLYRLSGTGPGAIATAAQIDELVAS